MLHHLGCAATPHTGGLPSAGVTSSLLHHELRSGTQSPVSARVVNRTHVRYLSSTRPPRARRNPSPLLVGLVRQSPPPRHPWRLAWLQPFHRGRVQRCRSTPTSSMPCWRTWARIRSSRCRCRPLCSRWRCNWCVRSRGSVLGRLTGNCSLACLPAAGFWGLVRCVVRCALRSHGAL